MSTRPPALQLYDVTVNGYATTLSLTAADAAARGLTPRPAPGDKPAETAKVPAKVATTPKNKARTSAAK